MSSPAVSPLLPAATPPRPMGLVFAAIVLGFMSCVGLFSGVSVLFVAQTPLLAIIQIVAGIFILLISGFCAFTVVGLFRMKRWARISILILGGLLAFYSLVTMGLYCVMAFSDLAAPPNTPGVPPGAIKVVFGGLAAFSLLLTLVGVWWLVYFNLRRIRALFAMNGVRFQPESLPHPALSEPELRGGPVPYPNSIRQGPSVIKVSLTCLAVLYLFGGASGIVSAVFHLPLFFMGFIFRGTSAEVLALAFGAISVGMGIGLLYRMKAAWVTALVFNAIGLVSILVMLTPRSRALMASYQQEIMQHMFGGIFPPPPNLSVLKSMYLFSAIPGVLMFVAVFWLLISARSLFESK